MAAFLPESSLELTVAMWKAADAMFTILEQGDNTLETIQAYRDHAAAFREAFRLAEPLAGG